MKAMKSAKKVPLELMLKNMNRFDEEADELYAKLNHIIETETPAKNAKREVHDAFFTKMMELMSKMRECRLDAQKCAVDAAPFMHQKLAATTLTITTDTIKAKPETQMSEDELVDYYAKLRMRPTTIAPLVIDNETGEAVNNDE